MKIEVARVLARMAGKEVEIKCFCVRCQRYFRFYIHRDEWSAKFYNINREWSADWDFGTYGKPNCPRCGKKTGEVTYIDTQFAQDWHDRYWIK